MAGEDFTDGFSDDEILDAIDGRAGERQRERERQREAEQPVREKPEVRSWADMQALPPLEWLVDGLLIDGGVSLLIGNPKSGKSTLARVLAATVAGHGNGRFLGRDVRGTRRVLYLAPDEAPQTTVQHFKGIIPPDCSGIDFCERAGLLDLAEIVVEGRYGLLIVDTLGTLFAEVLPDGDSYMDWQAPLARVREIANETGAHLCFVHHSRKAEGDRGLASLGSQAITGKSDTIIGLTTARAGDGYVRYIETTQRAGVELSRQRLTLAGDGWLTVEPRTPAADPGADAKAEARAMKRDGMSYQQIAEALGVAKSTAYQWARGEQ